SRLAHTICRCSYLLDRNQNVRLGEIPAQMLRELSGGALDFPVAVEVNGRILDPRYDLVVSIGQVVPHEVVGMANHTKNIFVGAGGPDIIGKSHLLGAVCDLEKILGRTDTPVRRLFDCAAEQFLPDNRIFYMLTVVANTPDLPLKGFFSGFGRACFEHAAELARQTNITMLDHPLRHVVAYLDSREFKSTWIGNKAIYRTRLAIADGGTLTILAPGLRSAGENPDSDTIIRRYGYCGAKRALEAIATDPLAADNLGTVAHLIHGAVNGRFQIEYCPGPEFSRAEVESLGYRWGDLDATRRRLHVESLRDGMNRVDGEEIFYISNPALGLWALRGQL
ncbi:MAG: hypothetical protein PHS41_01485, partial [Victivallaceae bacterium]|nr:hypothetical protein [Victivallaceae bacterium]